VDDAGLHPGVREDDVDRLTEAFQPVDPADEDVADAALLELVEHLQPEFGAFGRLEPEPSTSRSPSRLTPITT
jgi:hypothetical protein